MQFLKGLLSVVGSTHGVGPIGIAALPGVTDTAIACGTTIGATTITNAAQDGAIDTMGVLTTTIISRTMGRLLCLHQLKARGSRWREINRTVCYLIERSPSLCM